MVTMARKKDQWERASYLELEGQPRAPQAIAALLPQVLARYCSVPEAGKGAAPGSAKQLVGEPAGTV